jgi:hypothetical protein
MKRVLLTMAMGLTLSVLAQTPAIEKSNAGHFFNGRAWQKWHPALRNGYVTGFIEGLEIARMSCDGSESADKEILTYSPSGMTFDEIQSALDRFYEEPLNRRIQISWAMRIVAREASGKDATDEIRRMREISK